MSGNSPLGKPFLNLLFLCLCWMLFVFCICTLPPLFPLNCSGFHPKWKNIKFGVSYLTTVEMTLSELIAQTFWLLVKWFCRLFSFELISYFEGHYHSTAKWYFWATKVVHFRNLFPRAHQKKSCFCLYVFLPFEL